MPASSGSVPSDFRSGTRFAAVADHDGEANISHQDFMSVRRGRVGRRVVPDNGDDVRSDGHHHPSRRVVFVPGSEDGTPQSIQDRGPDETQVGTQFGQSTSRSFCNFRAGTTRPVCDLTVDDSDGTNVGQECDAVPHVAVCRGRFAVLAEEDTLEQGGSPVSDGTHGDGRRNL